jgi:hypothetical protein
MQNEFVRVSGFDDWYPQKRKEMATDDLMKFLKDKRNITVHIQGSVRPNALVKVTMNEPVVAIDEVFSVVIKRVNGTVEKSEPAPAQPPPQAKVETQATVEWLWYFVEFPDKDVVSVCAECIMKLESLVKECESRFRSSNALYSEM